MPSRGLKESFSGNSVKIFACRAFSLCKILQGCRTCSPGWVLPYIGYIGMYGPKGYGFSAVLVINRV